MAEFKVGSRVVYVGASMQGMRDKKGTVQSIDQRGWVSVKFDGQSMALSCAQVNLQLIDPRQDALQKAFAVLTEYLSDECPDDTNWEDFDPDVDDLRTQIDEMMQPPAGES